jgi:replicative DNA helicase
MNGPKNIEAEAALLGAMMTVASLCDQVLDIVTADDFAEPLHGRIFAALAAVHASGKQPNPVTIAPLFTNDPAMTQLGGPGYLAELTAMPASIIGARQFAEQVADFARRRRLIEGLLAVVSDASDVGGFTLPELLVEAENALAGAKGGQGAVEIVSPIDVANEIATSMGQPIEGVTNYLIEEANAALGKLRAGNLVIVAGRPGMGKSAFATSYCLGAAINGHGVLFVSLEMSQEELTERMLADLCYDADAGQGIPFNMIRDRAVSSDRDWTRFDNARRMMAGLPFRMVATGNLTPARLAGLARQTARRFEAQGKTLDLIVVDYLQLMRAPGFKGSDRVAEVSEISRSLKLLAKDMGVPVMALSQLSRAVESRPDKRPQLSDLRESGSIEQDADAVCFLFRAEYYLDQLEPEKGDPARIEWEAKKREVENVIEIIAAKKRHGRTGVEEARFYGMYQAMRGKPQ